MTSVDIETRLAKLEAVNAIKSLKIHYAMACDKDYDPILLAPMFAEDAVWDGGETFGRYDSRDKIATYFGGISDSIKWAMHYIVGGDITVHDDLVTAHGTWQLWCPVSILVDGKPEAAVLAAIYEDEYVQQDGEWLFKVTKVNFTLEAKMSEGWGENQFQLNPPPSVGAAL
jgi:hypothetical protein